jgi:hypothetical protein
MTDHPLRCECGKVRGRALNASPGGANRALCYCADCQALAVFLKRPEVLDAHGGSDIFQMAPANVQIVEGAENIRCMRLSPKGLHRWYADCCKTPLGNTLGPGMPFIGVSSAFIDGSPAERDRVFGKTRGAIHGKDARGGLPPGASRKVSFGFLVRTARLLIGWKLTGKAWPSPFFDARTKDPISTPTILTLAERQALRRA